MGLGVALFAAIGFDASAGALAGLTGAAVLSLVSGLTGATIGMISAPNGPVTMLLAASLASVAAHGVQGEGLLLALAAIMVLTGLFQFLLGISGGGQLIKYIPYPAVAGLVTGIGVLMVLSQLNTLSGEGAQAIGPGWMVVPATTALITFGSIKLAPRILPAVPGIISGLLVGFAAFHLIMLAAPAPTPESWLVGTIPGLDAIRFDVDASAFTSLPWKLILVSALTLAVLASMDCLLTAVVADGETGARHDARRELAAQGISQTIAGLLGGIGGGGTKGSTLVAIKTGGRRWSAIVSSLTFVVLILFLGPVGNALPISVLAGVIIYVGISMLEWNVLRWLRRPTTRLDGAVALLVVTTTLAFDLMVGVAVGVVSSVFLFLRVQVRARVIHERATGRERHSLHYRCEEERKLLDEHGDRILYFELRGNLFFGTVDRLFTELMPDLDRPIWMIFNLRRVQSLDMSGLNLFRQMLKRLTAHGGHMLYADVRKSAVMEREMHKLLNWLGSEDELPKVKTFKSNDAALEYAENELLKDLGYAPAPATQRVELEQNELFRRLKPKTREALEAVMRPLSLKRKEMVFTYGGLDNSLYFILQGEVEIRLPTRVYHYKRLAKVGPGSFFGEGCFLDPAPRTATAVVTQDVELLALDRQAIESLAEKRQREAGWAVLYELGGSLAQQLRWSRSELRRLERW
jgi:SulP family sulfate permease